MEAVVGGATPQNPADMTGQGHHQESVPAVSSPLRMRQHCFTETAPGEVTLQFQVLDLGRQLYVWVGSSDSAPNMNNLHMAIATQIDKVPSVTSLLPSNAISTGQSITQRLARRVGRPVMCSWNVPQSSQLLEAVAERRLLKELGSMELLASNSVA